MSAPGSPEGAYLAARAGRRERRERIATAVLAGQVAAMGMGTATAVVITDEVRKSVAYADALMAELDR